MIHFLYLIGFALFTGVIMGAISNGDKKQKLFFGLKIFAQFTLISLGLAWVFYFIPW
jgi:predicted cobalt transporter CbtA